MGVTLGTPRGELLVAPGPLNRRAPLLPPPSGGTVAT